MKILIVCSGNSGNIAPFVVEQVESIASAYDVEFRYFTVKEKGIIGYLKHLPGLKREIKEFNPDLIHAHYGFSGLLSNLQRKVPVVTTYHGSDINDNMIYPLSVLSILLSRFNVFVSEKNYKRSCAKRNFAIIPCGINIDVFMPKEKAECRLKHKLNADGKYVLFASAFDNKVKNPSLAKASVKLLSGVELLELNGFSRNEVAELMNAVDACLMTSISEGSPQFIKEAMACNRPIVSVNVGDVVEVTKNIDGCFICNNHDKLEIAEKLKQAISYGKPTSGRKQILELGYDTKSIAEKLMQIYNQAVEKN